MSKKEQDKTLADQAYWRSIAPDGWKLIAFTYRDVADFARIEGGIMREKIEVSKSHLEFFGREGEG